MLTVIRFMEEYTAEAIDAKGYDGTIPVERYHLPDFRLVLGNGTVVDGAGDAMKALQGVYAPFAEHLHDPTFLVTWETQDGYGMMGIANLFFNLHGPAPEAETGRDGKKWHGVVNAAYRFFYVQDGESFKMKSTTIFADVSPVLKTMLTNKLIDGEGLAGFVLQS